MARYYYGFERTPFLAHSQHKYIDRYKDKHGNWQYVYEEGNSEKKMTTVKDPLENVNKMLKKTVDKKETKRQDNLEKTQRKLELQRKQHAGEVIGDERWAASRQQAHENDAKKAALNNLNKKLAKEREAHSEEIIGDNRYTKYNNAAPKRYEASQISSYLKDVAKKNQEDKTKYTDMAEGISEHLANVNKQRESDRQKAMAEGIADELYKNKLNNYRYENEAVRETYTNNLLESSVKNYISNNKIFMGLLNTVNDKTFKKVMEGDKYDIYSSKSKSPLSKMLNDISEEMKKAGVDDSFINDVVEKIEADPTIIRKIYRK